MADNQQSQTKAVNNPVNRRLALRMANIIASNVIRNRQHMSNLEIQDTIEFMYAVNLRLLGESLDYEQAQLLDDNL